MLQMGLSGSEGEVALTTPSLPLSRGPEWDQAHAV
jgi:hypothetical protein